MHSVNMACSSACSKEFNLKESQVCFLPLWITSTMKRLKKKWGDEQFKALLNGRDTFACLSTGHGKTLIYQIAVLVARTEKVKILPSNPLCCGCLSMRNVLSCSRINVLFITEFTFRLQHLKIRRDDKEKCGDSPRRTVKFSLSSADVVVLKSFPVQIT